ncbi:MAG: acyl-CoA thioesterase [Pseudoclavibacter sp.]
MPPLQAFLSTLGLVDTGARTTLDIFTGPSQWMPNGRVFGGQVIAQSIMAAMRTIDDDRPIHSMHGYFLRPGDIQQPITFSVDRTHDGNSFTTRSVRAYQHGKPIFSMIGSFQADEEGLEHAPAMPEGVPDPESLPNEGEHVEAAGEALADHWVHRRPFTLRHVGAPIYLAPDASRATSQAVWVKTVDAMPDDPALHTAALAYVSDYVLLEPILRAHGIAWTDPRLRVASLDHAMWWHRFARVDEWLLYVAESTNAQSGRGLSRGQFFTRAGQHVATVAQEGMVRLKT